MSPTPPRCPTCDGHGTRPQNSENPTRRPCPTCSSGCTCRHQDGGPANVAGLTIQVPPMRHGHPTCPHHGRGEWTATMAPMPVGWCLDCGQQFDKQSEAETHIRETVEPVTEDGNVVERGHTVRLPAPGRRNLT